MDKNFTQCAIIKPKKYLKYLSTYLMTRLYYIFSIFQKKICVFSVIFSSSLLIKFTFFSFFFSLSTVQILPCMDKNKIKKQRNLSNIKNFELNSNTQKITFGDIFLHIKKQQQHLSFIIFFPSFLTFFSQIVSLFYLFVRLNYVLIYSLVCPKNF
jgi:hypothetical protein